VVAHSEGVTNTHVPRAALAQRSDWVALAAGTTDSTFKLESTGNLPEPAQRWLGHAIRPGTPLWSSVELTMHGEIRIGRWRAFRARQVLAPPNGFVWAAATRVAGLPVVGFDRYSGGTGEMRWRLLDLVPVLTAHGSDVTRSAAGRLAAEGLTFLPTVFSRASWSTTEDPDVAVATMTIGATVGAARETVWLRVDGAGLVRDVRLERWGNPAGRPFGRYPFGVTVLAERTFGGITIPASIEAGWWHGSGHQGEGEFFRATITAAVFR
jgi:hypothetical protein